MSRNGTGLAPEPTLVASGTVIDGDRERLLVVCRQGRSTYYAHIAHNVCGKGDSLVEAIDSALAVMDYFEHREVA